MIITLTTDFGPGAYVGQMKGAILSVNPDVTLVDLSHDIDPGDLIAAAWTLARGFSYFPSKTVHAVVVDPTVGTGRRGLAVEADDFFLVGPDNGVLWLAMNESRNWRAFWLTETDYFRSEVSATFHGRDIFGPVAAHLASGVEISKLGPEIDDPIRLDIPGPERRGNALVGRVLFPDRFGNLLTNLHREDVESFLAGRRARIAIEDRPATGLVDTYAQAPLGALCALFGSSGHLEIAVNGGSAKEALGLRTGVGPEVSITV